MKQHLQIILLIALSSFVSCSPKKPPCYAYERMPYKLFGSKTSYDEVRGYTVRQLDYPGCTPVQFYFLARHGTRYPKMEVVRRMRDRLPSIRDAIVVAATQRKGSLCPVDLENLKLWHSHLSVDVAEKLAPIGESELKATGMRFKIRFPDLLQQPRIRRKLDVRVIDNERVKMSAKFFMMGLWGDESRLPVPVEDHNLLRFYKTCRLWQNTVSFNHNAMFEVTKFTKGQKMENMIRDVTERVGLKWRLSQADIEVMYDACRFEAAWDEDSVSPWCAAFRSRDLKLLEYGEDIKMYYKHGYGHQINYMQACPPVRDLLERLTSRAIYNRSEPNIVLRFGSTGMLLKVLTRMGLFKDEQPPLASNIDAQRKRVWRTSYINPFASNLAFVLLECRYEHRVAAFFQERELTFAHCTSNPCPLADFLHMFQSVADGCDVDKICMA